MDVGRRNVLLDNSKFFLVIIAALAIQFVGCEKLRSKKTAVEVYVHNGSLNAPMKSGYSIALKELKTSSGGLGVSFVDEQIIDQNGMAYFEFNARRSSSFDYEIEFQRPGGEEFGSEVVVSDPSTRAEERIAVKNGEDQEVRLIVDPTGNLDFLVENLDPNSEVDGDIMIGEWRHQIQTLVKVIEGGGKGPATNVDVWIGQYDVYYKIVHFGDT